MGRPGADQDTPSELAMQLESLEAVRHCDAKLQDDEREVIRLADYEQLGYRVIAERLDIAVPAARQRHHRAVQRLRKLLREVGLGGVACVEAFNRRGNLRVYAARRAPASRRL